MRPGGLAVCLLMPQAQALSFHIGPSSRPCGSRGTEGPRPIPEEPGGGHL